MNDASDASGTTPGAAAGAVAGAVDAGRKAHKWKGNPWAILLTVSLGFFMTLLDLTIVNIAIPNMVDKLGMSLDAALWVVNAYVLVLAVLLITSGRLGDLLGKRNLFIAGVLLFTLASLTCGLAQEPAQLIAARAFQGLGAALLMPQTMSILIETFPAERRGVALGIWGAVAGVSTIAGPTVGGLLVTSLDWRWIFFVNLPIGVVVLVMAALFLPGTRRPMKHRFDVLGILIASVALFCLTFALTEGQKHDWSAGIWVLIGLAVVLFVAFLLQQRRRQDREPLVPFVLFESRNFTIMNFVGLTVSIGMIGLFLPMTIYLQSVLGYSALKAGLVMAPSSVVSMFLAPVAGRLSDRIGGKFLLAGGLVLYGIGMLWLLLIVDVDSSWVSFLPAFLVAGAGIGGVFAPMAAEAMREVPPQLAGAASAVNNTIRQVGSVLGAAAVGALLQNRLAHSLHDEAVRRATGLPASYRGRFVGGFDQAAKRGLDVGAGGSGMGGKPPAGLPQAVAEHLHQLGAQVFSHAFVDAMKPTIVLPVCTIFVGAVLCLWVKGYRAPGPGVAPEVVEAQEPSRP